MIWIVALVTAAAAAVGWLIARTVTGPLVRLTRAATDVERSGRLDVDVPAPADDEVGRLGGAFNGMLRALAASPRRPAPAGRGRRPRAAHPVDERAHEPGRAAPAPRPRPRHPWPRSSTTCTPRPRSSSRSSRRWSPSPTASRRRAGRAASRWPLGRGVAARAERRHSRPVSVVADDSVVEAPPPALERAISNLIDNATKFDTSGGPIDVTVVEGVRHRARPRPGHRPGRPAAGVRPLLPGRRGPLAARARASACPSSAPSPSATAGRRGRRPSGRRGGGRVQLRLAALVAPTGAGSIRCRCARTTYVVGLDGSEHAQASLDWAQAVAGPDDAIIVAHAWELPVVTGLRDRPDGRPDDRRAGVRGLPRRRPSASAPTRGSRAGSSPGTPGATSSTWPRRRRRESRLVVGHGGSSKASLLLGSTANYVIHHTDAAVVVVRGELRLPVRRVAVGVDEGERDDPDAHSLAALRWAVNLPGVERIDVAHADFVPAVAAGPVASRGWSPTRRVAEDNQLLGAPSSRPPTAPACRPTAPGSCPSSPPAPARSP